MCKLLAVCGLVILTASCSQNDQEYQNKILNHYPDLYEAAFARDSEALLSFTSDSMVSEQAWRALISTDVDDLDAFIERVKEVNTEQAWMALSMKELSGEQLSGLVDDYKSDSRYRSGIVRVLGRAGNQESLNFLVSRLEDFDKEGQLSVEEYHFEYNAALAIGRLSMGNDLSNDQMQRLIPMIISEELPEIQRAYLYGFYRSDKDIGEVFSEQLLKSWEYFDNKSQQFLIRILSHNDVDFIASTFNNWPENYIDTHLAVELGRTLTQYPINDDSEEVILKLLNHKNRSVRVEMMRNLVGIDDMIEAHPNIVEELNQIINKDDEEAVIRLEAGRSLAIQGFNDLNLDLFKELADENTYYSSTYLRIKSEILPNEIPVICKGESWDTYKTDDLKLFFVINSLNTWWANAEEESKENYLEEVQECIEYVLYEGSRSIVISSLGLLRDEAAFPDFEFFSLLGMYERFSLPADIELYQFSSQLLYDRFQKESQSFIDSMASYNNSALNNALNNQGWDVESEGEVNIKFRTPDWKRLADLGEGPVMQLKTDLGDITIRLYPQIAPATISGMDSLARAGDYNGVAFHRVVQNFVIQGGDIETGNGWGGPDYVVPTEASEHTYRRGTVGIASAGRDTEGSQYFIMHRPAEHLNGLYTIIGDVIYGMDVVDQIVVGDKVNNIQIKKARRGGKSPF